MPIPSIKQVRNANENSLRKWRSDIFETRDRNKPLEWIRKQLLVFLENCVQKKRRKSMPKKKEKFNIHKLCLELNGIRNVLMNEQKQRQEFTNRVRALEARVAKDEVIREREKSKTYDLYFKVKMTGVEEKTLADATSKAVHRMEALINDAEGISFEYDGADEIE